jgi:hypothetical protein
MNDDKVHIKAEQEECKSGTKLREHYISLAPPHTINIYFDLSIFVRKKE